MFNDAGRKDRAFTKGRFTDWDKIRNWIVAVENAIEVQENASFLQSVGYHIDHTGDRYVLKWITKAEGIIPRKTVTAKLVSKSL